MSSSDTSAPAEQDLYRRERDELLVEVREVRAAWAAEVERGEPLACGHPAACVRSSGCGQGATNWCGWCAAVKDRDTARELLAEKGAEAAMLREVVLLVRVAGGHLSDQEWRKTLAVLKDKPSTWLEEHDAKLRAEVRRQALAAPTEAGALVSALEGAPKR